MAPRPAAFVDQSGGDSARGIQDGPSTSSNRGAISEKARLSCTRSGEWLVNGDYYGSATAGASEFHMSIVSFHEPSTFSNTEMSLPFSMTGFPVASSTANSYA